MQKKSSLRISNPEFSQPLCTILRVALVEFISSYSTYPDSVVGHSSGEIASAYAAGYLSREEAWLLAYLRGRSCKESLQDEGQQSMQAVSLDSQEALQPLKQLSLDSEAFVTCRNSPTSTTLSGYRKALERVQEHLTAKSVFTRMLSVSRAYHSPLMKGAGQNYSSLLHTQAPTCIERTSGSKSMAAMYSSVTGLKAGSTHVQDFDYWMRNLLEPVNFEVAMSTALGDLSARGHNLIHCVEIGPHPNLLRATEKIAAKNGLGVGIRPIPSLRREQNACSPLAETLGHLFVSGVEIDYVKGLSLCVGSMSSEVHPLIDLPPYRFDLTQSYWLESRLSAASRFRKSPKNEFIGSRDVDWNPARPTWKNVLHISDGSWVPDHQFGGVPVFPGAGYLVTAIEALRQLLHGHTDIEAYEIRRNVFFSKSFELRQGIRDNELQTNLQPTNQSSRSHITRYEFHISGYVADSWVELCHGEIRAHYRRHHDQSSRPKHVTSRSDVAISDHYRTSSALAEESHHEDFYTNLKDMGYGYGSQFPLLRSPRYSYDGKASATIFQHPRSVGPCDEPLIHPTTLDAIVYLGTIGASEGGWSQIPIFMVERVQSIWISSEICASELGALQGSAEVTRRHFRGRDFDTIVIDMRAARPMVVARGMQGRAMSDVSRSEISKGSGHDLFYISWKPDVELSSPVELRRYLRQHTSSDSEITNLQYLSWERKIGSYIRNALAVVDKERVPSNSHLSKYYGWLQQRGSNLGSLDSATGSIPHPSTCDQAGLHSPILEAMERIGASLPAILEGSQSGLSLLFGPDELAERFYQSAFSTCAKVKSILSEVRLSMPAIEGCIHAGMVLKVRSRLLVCLLPTHGSLGSTI